MDSSSLGIAWGRFSHRRTRSSDTGSLVLPPPLSFTNQGARYTLAPGAAPSLLKPPSAPQHTRSKSWSTSKEKNQAADVPIYKTALSLPTNPLGSLRRAATGARRSHKTNSTVSSASSRNTSLHGSSSSIEIPQRSPLTSASSTPPQRPPRPARGLYEDEPDEGKFAPPVAEEEEEEETMQGLMMQSDQAFADVDLALAKATYNAHIVTQIAPAVSRSQSVRHTQQGLGLASVTVQQQQQQPPAPLLRRGGSLHSTRSARRNSLQSSHSTSSTTKGHHAARPSQPSATTKKMGKRNVLLPRKLRLTLAQSVNELLASRSTTAAKRASAGSMSSTYSDYVEEAEDQPSHKRNSSITAARRQQSTLRAAKRHTTAGTRFALCATDEGSLTASQMYHREMLPNSVVAWMGTDPAFADDEDDVADDDQELMSHEFANKCDLATEPNLPIQLPFPTETNTAEAHQLSVDGSSLPPPPPPPPPPKNPARFGARARTSHLSPIPEMLVVTPTEDGRRRRSGSSKISPKSKRGGANRPVKDIVVRDSLYLVGTAYSQSSPLFRHGHIEFQHRTKSRTEGEEYGEELNEDDELDQHVDWPAFHSSVLCDADDLEAGFAQDEADAMADELGDWFDEFGFESHGALVRASLVPGGGALEADEDDGDRAASSRSTASSRSSASTISDADLPMPASPDRSPSLGKLQSWSFAQAERHDYARSDPHASDPIPVSSDEAASRGLGLDTYGLPPAEKEVVNALPLLKQGSSRGPRMGCNLSEDLGQFLAWNPTVFDDIHEAE